MSMSVDGVGTQRAADRGAERVGRGAARGGAVGGARAAAARARPHGAGAAPRHLARLPGRHYTGTIRPLDARAGPMP